MLALVLSALLGSQLATGPINGERAVEIDGRRGAQSWESGPVAARPGQKYLLRWRTRFHGEKAWRFRARFCGVQVTFQGDAGERLGSVRQHSSAWQTPDWRPAWCLFSTPEGTSAVAIAFALETGETLPGGFDVDGLELSPWPPEPQAGSCLLSLRLEDEERQPVAARLRIANAAGEAIVPPGAIAYDRLAGAFHPLEEGACHALVPPGRYTITAARGFEVEPWSGVVEAHEGRLEVTVRLRRLWDWRQRGWLAGDHHTHLFRHGGSLFPSLTWRDALRAARAEGLDFLPFMGADRCPPEPIETLARELRRPDFVAELTDEITEDFWGHVCPVGASEESRRDPRYDAGPMNFDRHAAIAGAGGILCYGHPYGPLEDGDGLEPLADLKSGLVAREFPIDLALGMPCGVDLLTMEGDRNRLERKLRDVYRLYNLGFRPALTAATDFHVNQGRQPFGAVRTYVRSGALDLGVIAAAYRAGRTFATNGPLIDLRVAGAGPGEQVVLPSAGERMQVTVEAVSIGRLERVDLIVNGGVVQSFTAGEPHRIAGECEVPAPASLWIAAKAIGPADERLASALERRPLGAGQIAHTSPVYVIVAGKPILAGQPSDADYFARWCDAVLAAWKARVAAQPEEAKHDALVTERIERARGVFRELGARLGTR